MSSSQLAGKFQWRPWWRERNLIPPVQRLSELIGEVMLDSAEQNFVIFIDEIDSVLGLKFPLDDFFAMIRACYNKRVDYLKYKRLAFALFGVATPSDLIQDKTRTPFNIGKAIELDGFEFEQSQVLIEGLKGKVDNPQAVLKEVLAWTGGQPFLTQKLCKFVVQEAGINPPQSLLTSGENLPIAEWVGNVVRSHIIENWESQDEPEHLRTIRDRILRREQRAGRLLGLYQKLLQQGGVAVDDSPEQMELRLSGLVVKCEGKLEAYNRIYESVFDLNWVEKELANLRPYAEAFNAWLASDSENESRLLRGQVLQDAQAWAAGKSLGDLDYQFFAASQDLDKREILEAERQAKQILAEAQQKAEFALEEERQANQRLAEAQRKTKRQMVIGATVLALSVLGAMVALIVAGKAHQDRVLAESQRKKASVALVSVRSELGNAKQGIQTAREQKNAAQKAADKAKQDQQKAKSAWEKAAQEAQQANQNLIGARNNLEVVRGEAQQKNQQLAKANQDVQAATKTVKSAQAEADKAKQVQQQAEKQTVQAQQRLNQAQVQLNEAEVALNAAQKITELERAGASALKQFESGQQQEIEALLLALQSGQALKALVKDSARLKNYPAYSLMLALQTIVNNIRQQNQFPVPEDSVYSISFSRDGKTLLTAGGEDTARLWNLSGQQVAEYKAHQVGGVGFKPKGKTITTVEIDGTEKLWNLSEQQLAVFNKLQGEVESISFSPDGQTLATGGRDGIARLWNLSGQQLAEFKAHERQVDRISFSPDGQTLATGGGGEIGTTRLWNLSGQQLAEFKSDQTWVRLSFSPDGKTFATAGEDNTVRLWSLSRRQLAEFKAHEGGVYSVSFSPDGKTFATVGSDATARLWNFATKQQLAEFKAHQNSARIISLSPDSKTLATTGLDGIVRLGNLSGQQLAEFKAHQDWVHSVSFSPDGKTFATVGDGGTARLWNLSGQQLAEFKVYQGWVKSVKFSPDGKILATTGSDCTTRLWNLSGQQFAEFQGYSKLDEVDSVSFSPDGKTLALAGGDDTARLWNLTTKQQLTEFKVYQSWVVDINFSPDGKTLATAGADGTAKLWNLSGQQLAEFKAHQDKVMSVTFSPGGKTLATAGIDGTVKLWRIDELDELLARGCNWLKDYFVTHSEEQKVREICKSKSYV